MPVGLPVTPRLTPEVVEDMDEPPTLGGGDRVDNEEGINEEGIDVVTPV